MQREKLNYKKKNLRGEIGENWLLVKSLIYESTRILKNTGNIHEEIKGSI